MYIFIFGDNIFHLDVHYVCMLVQLFEPQGRRFTNFHYYYIAGPAVVLKTDTKNITQFYDDDY